MKQFISNTNKLNDIYRHLEARPLGPESDAPLKILPSSFHSPSQIRNFPIANYKERDICTHVRHNFSKPFNDSLLTLAIEQASNASKEDNLKEENSYHQPNGKTTKSFDSRYGSITGRARICHHCLQKYQRQQANQ
ncbi:hypothetical protein MAM1_0512c10794 [Mucor ambiguus]|uniref:Uncharacterized protein n=1 Tax=Mucor ambiguus TaxID=91626 RepID=A0A0C9LYQ7_9FUNG|nr:hypothetical protein MAM1_0512c10794 [Mucor ambiguus]